jgi:hypothetical protein
MLAGLRGLVHLELPAQTPWNAEKHSHALPSILQEQKQLALPRLNCSLETADGPDHTALVASSKTQTLHTSGPNAPVNTWQYVCQLGQLLQQLTSLQLDVTCTVRPMSPGKLHKLADACSALQQLSLHPGELTFAKTKYTCLCFWSHRFGRTNSVQYTLNPKASV